MCRIWRTATEAVTKKLIRDPTGKALHEKTEKLLLFCFVLFVGCISSGEIPFLFLTHHHQGSCPTNGRMLDNMTGTI